MAGISRGLMRKRPDPLLSFRFSVVLQLGSTELPSEYVEEVQIPGMRTNVDQVFRAGIKKSYAKDQEASPITMKLYADVNNTSLKFLSAWRNKIHKENGNNGLPKDYWGTLIVTPLTPTGEEVVSYQCIGVFPTKCPDLNQIGSSSDAISWDVEFSVNEIITVTGR